MNSSSIDRLGRAGPAVDQGLDVLDGNPPEREHALREGLLEEVHRRGGGLGAGRGADALGAGEVRVGGVGGWLGTVGGEVKRGRGCSSVGCSHTATLLGGLLQGHPRTLVSRGACKPLQRLQEPGKTPARVEPLACAPPFELRHPSSKGESRDRHADRPPGGLAPRGSGQPRPHCSPAHRRGFVREFLRELNFGQGVGLSRSSVNDQYLALARTVRHYLMARWLETAPAAAGRRRPRASATCRPSTCSAASSDNALLATDLDDDRRGGAGQPAASTWPTLRAAGGRAGPRQRRPRPARRLLHRLAGDDERAVHRLRHPLRVRHLPPDLRRRPAGRAARRLARAAARRGSSRTRRPRVTVDFGGHTETTSTTTASTRTRWVPGWNVLGVPYNYMVPGYQNGRVNTLRLWSAQATRAFDLRDLQRRRLRRGRPRADLRREHLEGALPRGLHAAGQGAAPAAAVLLRRLLASATSSTSVLPHGLRPAPAARADHLPAQRHPPGDRGPRAHARSSSTRRAGVGRGVGDHPAVLRLHLPHPAARGARGLVGRAARPAAAAAPRDHLPDQRRVPRRGPRAPTRDDELRIRRMSIIAEYPERSVRMAYLATVAGAKVNGVAELHSQLLRDKVLPDFSELLAGQVHQRHQRRHARAASCGWPTRALSDADHRRASGRAG